MESSMIWRILLIEPYDDVAQVIGLYLEDLGHEFDLVTDASGDGERLIKECYECVLINVDQNSDEWRDHGLRLAETASRNHTPVVMIADHELDDAASQIKRLDGNPKTVHFGKAGVRDSSRCSLDLTGRTRYEPRLPNQTRHACDLTRLALFCYEAEFFVEATQSGTRCRRGVIALRSRFQPDLSRMAISEFAKLSHDGRADALFSVLYSGSGKDQ